MMEERNRAGDRRFFVTSENAIEETFSPPRSFTGAVPNLARFPRRSIYIRPGENNGPQTFSDGIGFDTTLILEKLFREKQPSCS